MNAYDDVPPFKTEVGPRNDYDCVAMEERDVVSVKSVDEDWDEMDNVDGAEGLGDVPVEVVPAKVKTLPTNARNYVINDDDKEKRGGCYWCFVICITLAILLYIGFATVYVFVFIQNTSASDEALSTGNKDTFCPQPTPVMSGNFTPFGSKFKENEQVKYNCLNDDTMSWNLTCKAGEWIGPMGNCSGEEYTTQATVLPDHTTTELHPQETTMEPITGDDGNYTVSMVDVTTSA